MTAKKYCIEIGPVMGDNFVYIVFTVYCLLITKKQKNIDKDILKHCM
jgi:hypothetical protein